MKASSLSITWLSKWTVKNSHYCCAFFILLLAFGVVTNLLPSKDSPIEEERKREEGRKKKLSSRDAFDIQLIGTPVQKSYIWYDKSSDESKQDILPPRE